MKSSLENLILGIIFGLFLFLFVSLSLIAENPDKEKLIDCETEKIFIDYQCVDGRSGFTTLEEWSEIHYGCYSYEYYHKCKGISKLIPSEKIK